MDLDKKNAPINVLVVDDNKHDRDAIVRILVSNGYNITDCGKGETALELLRDSSNPFDVLVTDYNLPGISGIELHKKIVTQIALLPTVILTGSGSEHLAIEALMSGVDDYVVKDVADGYLQLLPKVITRAINKHNDQEIRKKTEEALKVNEELLSKTMDSLLEAVLVIDAESITIKECNKAAERIFGYDRSEMICQSTSILHVDEKFQADFRKHLYKAVDEKGYLDCFEFNMKRKDGTIFPTEHSVTPILDEKNNRKEWVSVVRDITERKKAETALRESEKSLQNITSTIGQGVLVTDTTLNITFINPEAARLLGWTEEELMGENAHTKFHYLLPDGSPHDFDKCVAANSMKAGKNCYNVEDAFVRKDGTIFPISLTSTCLEKDGEVSGAVLVFHDITERKQAEEKLKLSAMVFDNATEGVMVTGIDGEIEYVNPSFTTITGYSYEEAIGQDPSILKSDRHDEAFYMELWRCLKEEGQFKGEMWNRRKNGELFIAQQSINAIKDSGGKTIQYACVFQDITQIKQSADDVAYHAYHDLLTGLPNRSLFIDRLKQAIGRGSRDKQSFALLFVDIDDFKKINDNFGHAAGDLLIQGVGMRLSACARDTDTVSRYAGDEFVVIVENIKSESDVAPIAEKIIKSLSEPYMFNGKRIISTVSIGIALYPTDGETGEQLVKNADFAMYHVKDQSKNNYSFFTKELNEEAAKRFVLEQKMRAAIENNEFVVHYQPKVSLSNGHMQSMEALVRWQLAGKIVSPDDFIPLAEETGLILPIGEFVLRSACKQLKAWQDMGYNELSVSVNISARQLDRENLLEVVRSTLDESMLEPGSLCLEVTETAIMTNMDVALATLEKIKKMGVKISLDDFGTGYSSLSHLRRFPIDEIKIDRFFVMNIPDDKEDSAIAATIISLARNLKLSVVAEGVENKSQLNFLREAGCDEMQGYFFSRPIGAEAMGDLLKEQKALSFS